MFCFSPSSFLPLPQFVLVKNKTVYQYNTKVMIYSLKAHISTMNRVELRTYSFLSFTLEC